MLLSLCPHLQRDAVCKVSFYRRSTDINDFNAIAYNIFHYLVQNRVKR